MKIVTVTVTRGNPAPEGYYVLPDQFTHKWKFAVRPAAPCPAVFRTGVANDTESFQRAIFSAPWQIYAVNLLALAKYAVLFSKLTGPDRNDIVQAFCSLYASETAFNNGSGVDICKNYITGELVGREDAKIDPLICAGNVVAGDIRQNVVRLSSFLVADNPPEPNLTDRCVLYATTIRPDGQLRRFPHLEGLPVPYPYIAVEPYYYPLNELSILE